MAYDLLQSRGSIGLGSQRRGKRRILAARGAAPLIEDFARRQRNAVIGFASVARLVGLHAADSNRKNVICRNSDLHFQADRAIGILTEKSRAGAKDGNLIFASAQRADASSTGKRSKIFAALYSR